LRGNIYLYVDIASFYIVLIKISEYLFLRHSPRTDSKFITEDMAHGIGALVDMSSGLLANLLGGNFTVNAFAPNIPIIVDNSKVTDHHAILPTIQAGSMNIVALNTDERNILLMICSKLICAVNEKHTYAETTVTVACCDEIFTAKGKVIKNNGWKQVEDDFLKGIGRGKKGEEENTALPTDISEGQKFTANTAVREGFTSPPKPYTEDIRYKGGKRKPPKISWQRPIRSRFEAVCGKRGVYDETVYIRYRPFLYVKKKQGVTFTLEKLPPLPTATPEGDTG